MAEPSPPDHDGRYNRDEEIRPSSPQGQPPRPATEPKGSRRSSKDAPTATDPETGESKPSRRKTGR
jgi:hypothetical protein